VCTTNSQDSESSAKFQIRSWGGRSTDGSRKKILKGSTANHVREKEYIVRLSRARRRVLRPLIVKDQLRLHSIVHEKKKREKKESEFFTRKTKRLAQLGSNYGLKKGSLRVKKRWGLVLETGDRGEQLNVPRTATTVPG